jgi:hypothetical protein
VKKYQVHLPVSISCDGNHTPLFNHSINLEVSAKSEQEAIKQLTEVLVSTLTKETSSEDHIDR